MVFKKTNILWNSSEFSKIFNKNIDKDWTCTGVEIDSRKVKPGNIFLAMPGTEFDGHNFIKDAINMGANSLICLLYTSPSPRDATLSRMPSSA